MPLGFPLQQSHSSSSHRTETSCIKHKLARLLSVILHLYESNINNKAAKPQYIILGLTDDVKIRVLNRSLLSLMKAELSDGQTAALQMLTELFHLPNTPTSDTASDACCNSVAKHPAVSSDSIRHFGLL